jgi:uncharacterized protein with GYD domain
MATYILLTRLSPEAVASPAKLKELEQEVKKKVQKNCPKVKWVADYAVLGPCDYLDIFEAPDESEASKVATIIRSFGHATTETWTAIPWARFRDMMAGIA